MGTDLGPVPGDPRDVKKVTEVVLVNGQRFEVEASDRDLEAAMDRGIILPAKVLRGSEGFDLWRINGAHIAAYMTDGDPVD